MKMTKEEFLAEAEKCFTALQELDNTVDFYDYESRYSKKMKEFARVILQKSISNVPANRKKKVTIETTYGPIEVAKDSPYSEKRNGHFISPLLQELCVYAAQSQTYSKGSKDLKKYKDIEVCEAQLYRVGKTYGEEIGKTVNKERLLPAAQKPHVAYVMVDGSYLMTRKEKWKEAKVGRIFLSSDCIQMDEKPGIIRRSQYVVHFGDHQKFIEQMDPLIESFAQMGTQLVFITDGAVWIRNWIEDSYPESVSLLDYYHAAKYLHEYAHTCLSEEDGKIWVEEQKALLLENKLDEVIENIEAVSTDEKSSEKIIKYYTDNQQRMDYQKARQTGAGLIGSGAIESAHRTVIQSRLKLSGQRWTISGAQNMLNLRVTEMNQQWGQIVRLVKTEFKRAA